VKVLTAICVLVLAGTGWAQSAVSDSSKPTLKTFTSLDGTFRITYPDLLVRCERVLQKDGLSYYWEQPGCSAYIPPCSNSDGDDQPVLCLAYPPKRFVHNPTFDAAVLTIWEITQSEKQCLADADHPLKSISIQGVKFKGGESADAAMNRTRNSKGYTAYRNGKCYGLSITTITTSGAAFDPSVTELTKHDWEEVARPLEQTRDSFEFLK
jgi:hypothetical protein